MNRISILSYNIHSCIGSDGTFLPERILGVIQGLAPDIVCLQEVGWHLRGERFFDQFAYLARETGFHIAYDTTKNHRHAFFGNVILSRFPILEATGLSLKVRFRIPRGAVIALIQSPIGPIYVANAHFGLDYLERKQQAALLHRYLIRLDPAKSVLCGDFNEPTRARYFRDIDAMFGARVAPLTFPARFPLLALDRVYVGTAFRCHTAPLWAWVPGVRTASDHLPILVSISEAAPAERQGTTLKRDVAQSERCRRVNQDWDREGRGSLLDAVVVARKQWLPRVRPGRRA